MTNERSGFNNMQSLKDEFCVWSEAGSTSIENDIGEEYILPDYLPDIRKILLVKARIYSSDIFVEDQKAEISGEVRFNIVYLSDTGEIKCINQNYDYNGKSSMESIYEDSIINEKSYVKSRSVRAASQRKLVIKAKVISDLNVYNKVCVSPRLTGSEGVEDEFTLERKINEIDCVNFIKIKENDIRISEDIEYSGRMPMGEIIYSDLDVFATDCKFADGKINIKGYAKFTCLFGLNTEGEESQYDVIEKNIPINSSSDANLPNGEWCLNANFIINAFECGVANDSYGEPRVLEVDFSLSADVLAMANERSMFTDDVYSTKYEYSNKFKTVNTESVVKCCNVNFSASGTGELQDSDENASEVVLSSGDCEINAMENRGDKLVFTGECNVKCLLKNNDNSFMNTEFSFPLRYEMPNETGNIGKYICNCNVSDLRVKLDGNKLNANAEICMNIILFENISADTIENVNIDKSRPFEKSNEKVMILYYPEATESLWTIAKKYNISPNEIEKANNRQLQNGLPRVLIIPV